MLKLDVVRLAIPPLSGTTPRIVEYVVSLKVTVPVGKV